MEDISITKPEECVKNLMSGDKKKSGERRENNINTLFMEEWRKIHIDSIENAEGYEREQRMEEDAYRFNRKC